jgi:hypothetical protein
MPMCVLGIIIPNYSSLQIIIQVFHQGCQRIIEEVAMWQIPMKTTGYRTLETGTRNIVRNNCGAQKYENFPHRIVHCNIQRHLPNRIHTYELRESI